MKSAMRFYRRAAADSSGDSRRGAKYLARDIAFYMGWLGPYTADDGWQGPNHKNYTTDSRIHGRFESWFVDLIQLSDESAAFADKNNQPAALLAKSQLAEAAAKPLTPGAPETNPINRANPRYNPETGATPPGPAVRQRNL